MLERRRNCIKSVYSSSDISGKFGEPCRKEVSQALFSYGKGTYLVPTPCDARDILEVDVTTSKPLLLDRQEGMPYTPPSQRSPASSKSNSPTVSRTHSFDNTSVPSERPVIARSKSAAYLHKHRRSPSVSDHSNNGNMAVNGFGQHIPRSRHDAARHVSPAPAVGSPQAGSPLGSEDDYRGRQIQHLAESLKETMKISKRTQSPTREVLSPVLALTASKPALPPLTAEARKISHSRSSSEVQLSALETLTDGPVALTSESDDDEYYGSKPLMVRKKSGELVKPALRPPINRRRPSSMPGTPTFVKNVHFNEDAQVRHFLKVDKPIAVSAGSSPVETYDSESEYPFYHARSKPKVEWELRLANFPRDTHERLAQAVRVERLFLSSDFKMLIGTVAVANLAFHKHVTARFTFDYWSTTSEVTAEYNNDVRKKQSSDGFDRFNFSIKLSEQAHLESKTLLLCVRYNVEGQEFWDSNQGSNYMVDFVKKVAPSPDQKHGVGSGVGPLGAIPRSRHSPSVARPRSYPAGNHGDDDWSHTLEQPAPAPNCLRTDPLRAGKNARKQPSYPTQVPRAKPGQPIKQAFSTRYDFSASLSAALTTAQTALGDQSGLKMKDVGRQSRSSAPAVQPVNSPRPDALSSVRPDVHSAEYNDLIQKFCYYRPNPTPTPVSSPKDNVKAPNTKTPSGVPDGPVNSPPSDTDTDNESGPSSGSNSPPSPRAELQQLDGTCDSQSTTRTASPSYFSTSPRLLAQYRSASPALQLPHQVVGHA
ncbi:hypothetical protein EJ06DRAFT_581711 [Trichodelitschia bisporula]|uniref:CBM21 domain-containing protein n=1 Tax=Trichodelitschia bisporula TaxID=703511 RepID=A0A6G1HXZ4_9PEZI|nr:hypothetical protein EJ06DRAFT_581711 [Trichodelitschia bisporula]